MNRLRLILPVLALLMGLGLVGIGGAGTAHAQATGMVITGQACQANGTVSTSFAWTPSRNGSQWFDISRTNDNFSSAFMNAGPLPPSQAGLEWWNPGMAPNTTYYFRVNTLTSGGWTPSSTWFFTTIPCAGPGVAFSPPTGLDTSALSGGAIRFDWDAGAGNAWYCVDTALSAAHLTSYSGTWWNHGCGTTATFLDVSGLGCGQLHYWRVWAVGANQGAHSAIAQFTTPACNFSPPTNPVAEALSPTSARFDWDRGEGNSWFCVDVALTEADLMAFSGSWRNYGCGTTSTLLDVTGLECATNYYWRVYAQGSGGAGGHSPVARAETQACGFTPPTNLKAEALSGTAILYTWTKGSDNQWFCVDTAKTVDDLRNFGATFKNHGCGTTDPSLRVRELECNTEYFWRVYARGTTIGGHSVEATSKTQAC